MKQLIEKAKEQNEEIEQLRAQLDFKDNREIRQKDDELDDRPNYDKAVKLYTYKTG